MKAALDCGLTICLLLATAFLDSGCKPAAQRADLVFLNGAEPESLDPAVITGQPEERIVSSLFEGLLGFDSAAHPQPGVAETWEISADKRVYTFHLRHNALWSNGDPVTARDFLASWKRALEPETASDYASLLYFVKNGRPYNEGTLKDFSQVGVRVVDDFTLEVTLTKSSYPCSSSISAPSRRSTRSTCRPWPNTATTGSSRAGSSATARSCSTRGASTTASAS